MATLTFPFTLTAGQPENVNQLNSNLAAIRTVLNGGVDGTNAPVFGQVYRTVAQVSFNMTGGLPATLYLPTESGIAVANGTATSGAAAGILALDPADYAITGMTTKYRLKVASYVNNTAPAINFTFGLHNITSVAGAAGILGYTANTTAVTSSTVTLTTPASSTGNTSTSSQFGAPASGFYAIGVTTSGLAAGNSVVGITALLQAVNS